VKRFDVELYDSIGRGIEDKYVEAVDVMYSLNAVNATAEPKGDLP
jgi:hypothetical protein